MKKLKLFTISLVITAITIITTAPAMTAFAAKACTQKSECSSSEICDNGTCKNLIDTLTQRNEDKPAENVKNLPDISLESFGATVVKSLLGWSMLFTIAAIVVAAFYYLIAQGKEEDLSKAKSIILYLIIGLAVMAGAYGIVAGITQFNFFK